MKGNRMKAQDKEHCCGVVGKLGAGGFPHELLDLAVPLAVLDALPSKPITKLSSHTQSPNDAQTASQISHSIELGGMAE
jgi:hypothetical protein